MSRFSLMLLKTLVAASALMSVSAAVAASPLVVVVMDPLSKPLSCDCVQGYAQREYKLLGQHLEATLQREVKVVWFESLAEALKETDGKADLVIGKHSVVLADEKSTSHSLRPLAQLTGKDGAVTQKGLIVVRRDDAAKDLKDLRGYRVLMGPTDAEEKSSAAEAALDGAGVKLSGKRERFGACSEAATALLELPGDVKAAAVISSYAEPLLEGCGSINKGDLRVVGETAPVPFVTAFVSEKLSKQEQETLLVSLVSAGTNPEILTGLETLAGFVPWEEKDKSGSVKKKSSALLIR
ncbi:MAG: phosphate/phosphite/phosphonate ABC transporter substrate-binding protein [Pirellulales bacterium]|nr:phosphate/phosphite/phosphonate ABC transporter substrate-binding protein [Pirellulales bacterium]